MTPTRILIVEDEATVARDIEGLLKGLGHDTVGIAASGEEAIALAEAFNPQLVLIDIQLDGAMDGVEAALAIRARSPIPVIFLTAYATDDVTDRAKLAQPAGYIIKPFAEADLSTTIEIAMQNVSERARSDDIVRLQGAALSAAANAIVITDRDGQIQWVNPAFAAMTGYSQGEVIGRNPRDLVKSGAHGRAFFEDMWQTLLAGKVWEGEITNRRRDGTLYVEEQTITPVRNAAGEITNFVGIKRDLTDQKRLQAQFLQAQKMEIVGRLAGGVAHDFNNLLTVINGTADLALMDLPPDHPLRGDFENIQDAGNRAALLTRQLLMFSRKQLNAPVGVNLSTSLANTAGLLRRLIGEDIHMVVDAEAGLDTVLVDPAQFEQVLLNLAVNARDAMPDGGTLTIETRNVNVDDAFAEAHAGMAPGPHVMLSVTDTGAGMTAEVRSRLFEPFFTTKELGKGTGLGLATVHDIVMQGKGGIVVASEPGHGACFRIFLPSVPGVHEADVVSLRQPLRGTETILLVEDDDRLRELAARMLLTCGYTVLAAAGARQALSLLQKHEGRVHLVLTDVVMPGMTGYDLAAQIAESQPRTRVLFASGYLDDARLGKGVLAPMHNFVAKPYTIAVLTRKIREILDAPAAGG